MQIFLIRHGLTELGEQKRYQGSLDTPLSENGRKQLQPAGFVPEWLAVSPLLRARETARVLFPNSRQTVIPGLQEMLLQETPAGELLLFPAWPKEWNVSFRLRATDGRIVEAQIENGVVKHTLSPQSIKQTP